MECVAHIVQHAAQRDPGWTRCQRHREGFVQDQVVELRVQLLPLLQVRLGLRRLNELIVALVLVARVVVGRVIRRPCASIVTGSICASVLIVTYSPPYLRLFTWSSQLVRSTRLTFRVMPIFARSAW